MRLLLSSLPFQHFLKAQLCVPHTPESWSRDPLDLSKNPFPSFPGCMKHSYGELIPNMGLEEDTQIDPGLTCCREAPHSLSPNNC